MARVQINPNLERELARAPEMAAMMKRRMEAAEAAAHAVAPVGKLDDPHSGRFRDSIHGEVAIHDGRVVGHLRSDDPAAVHIIAGTSDTPPHDTLMRAIEMTARG